MLTNKDLIFPSYMTTYERYFPIDADGKVGRSGWTQRPAAERHTGGMSGMGLWDAREKRIITQPDAGKQTQRLNETINRKREEIERLEAKVNAIHAVEFRTKVRATQREQEVEHFTNS
jgi:hypothetical protein